VLGLTTYTIDRRLFSKPPIMKTFLTTLILFGSFSLAFSQGNISSITISPANPTVNDDMVIYVDVQFSNSDCIPDYQTHSLQGTTIGAAAHHCVGALTAICNTTDTFEIGQLPIGTYTFDMTLTSGFGGPGCSPGFVPDDNDQLQFSVTGAVGVPEVELSQKFIYPNPTIGALHFSQPLNESAYITSLSGQFVRQIPSGTSVIDVSELESGVYIIHSEAGATRLVIN
jgi:hypothetical protein